MKNAITILLVLLTGFSFGQYWKSADKPELLMIDYGMADGEYGDIGIQGTISYAKFFEETTGLMGSIGMYGYENVDYTWVGGSVFMTFINDRLWAHVGVGSTVNEFNAFPQAGARVVFLKESNFQLGGHYLARDRSWKLEQSYGISVNILLQ